MKSYGETPWWCQLPWPWSGPPWYAQIEARTRGWPRSGGSSPGGPVSWSAIWIWFELRTADISARRWTWLLPRVGLAGSLGTDDRLPGAGRRC